MAYHFPSDAWIKELSTQLNASEAYQRSAKDWEGDFLFVVEADGQLTDTTYLYLGLYHGKSPNAMKINHIEEQKADYTITAPYSTWCKVVKGKIDPIQGLMTRQLKLKGNMMMVMRYPKAAKEIMTCTAQIPTTFTN